MVPLFKVPFLVSALPCFLMIRHLLFALFREFEQKGFSLNWSFNIYLPSACFLEGLSSQIFIDHKYF